MSTPSRLALALALALAPLPVGPRLGFGLGLGFGPAAAQEGRDPRASIEAFEGYLARKPYHDWAFDKLVEAAVAINALPELVLRYEQRAAEGSEGLAPRVVLARLLARTDRLDEALAVLATVDDADGRLHRLVGSLQLRAGNWEPALEALDRAAAATTDRALLEEIHKQRGQAHLAAGDREGAARAFRDLAALDQTSFHLRLEASTELAWHGLTDQALEEFAVADELAGQDASKRCRVLSEIGRLHERQARGQEAVAAYRRAIALLARGHWLKRDLFDRILAVHRRAGTLDQLVEHCRSEAGAGATDLDAREFLARALEATGEREQARDVLRTALADFPGDLALSRRLLGVLEVLGDDEGRIAEYQRMLGERPQELELYLELGQVFASSGRFEQARRQWSRTLEQRLDDAGLCVRLAGLYALYDQSVDAVAMYEKAIALEPDQLRHYADLAAFLAVHERGEEVPALLERADGAARGNAGRLAEVASLWSEYGQTSRARAALEAALALSGEDARLLYRLADVVIREGQIERATEILHRVAEEAGENALRGSAVDRLLRLFHKQGRSEELAALEERTIAADPAAIAPRLVLGKLFVQGRQPERALEVYEGLIAVDPASEDGHRALARLYEERGELDRALEQLELLIAARPQARRRYLKEVARLHLARHDQERAFACYEEILRGAPDNPAAFREVADAYDKLGLFDEVLECLQQAVRLDPDDARTRLDLADAWKVHGEWERAREEIEAAVAAADDEDLRETARGRLYVLFSETGRLEEEIEALRVRVAENPYDADAPLTLTDIYVRELEYELALEMLDRLLTFQPRQPDLIAERARLYRFMQRFDEAIADYETLWKLPDTDRKDLALDIADASLEAGDLERAAKVLAGVGDVSRVAGLYRRHDLPDDAIRVLQKGIAGSAGDGRLLLTLSRLQEDIGDRQAAATTLEQLLALRGDSWRVLVKLGELYHLLDREEDSLAVGERLFAMIRADETVEDEDEDDAKAKQDPWGGGNRGRYRWFNANQRYQERLGALKTFFESKGRIDDFLTLGRRELALQRSNSVLYSTVLNALRQVGDREEQARRLIRETREVALETGRAPAGTTHEDWLRRLDRDESRLYQTHSVLARERVAELEGQVAAGTASARHYRELAQLHQTLQNDAQKLATLEQGVAAHPDSIPLLAGLALTLEGERRYAEAAEAYQRVVERIAASDWRQREAERLEHGFKAGKRALLQRFPVHVRRKVNDELLRRLYGLSESSSTSLNWTFGYEPSLDGARMTLARCLIKLERTDEARAVLRDLEPADPDNIPRWVTLATTYYSEDLYDEAEEIYQHLLDLEAELERHPVLGHERSWAGRLDGAMRNHARILEKRGQVLEAYEVLRTYGQTQEAELLLTTHEAFDDAEQHYRDARERAGRDLDDPGADTRAWREATVRLADVLQFQKRWEEVLALYEELAGRIDDDFSILEHIAALHLRAGRVDDAVATRYRIIERKRDLNRHVRPSLEPEGRVLYPTAPGGQAGSAQARRLSGLGYYSFSPIGYGSYQPAQRGPGGLYSLREDYMAILRLHLDRKEPTRAAEVLSRIAREDAASFRWMGWEVRNLIQNHQLGENGLPILRLMHSYNAADDYTSLEYGKALVQADHLDEAHKILTRLANGGRRSSWYHSQARQELEKLEARMGLDSRETLEELLAASQADPKNVKTRMKLVRRLFKERRFEEALEHGRAAEALAPHQDEVADFVVEALQVLGRREELEQRLRAKLGEESQSEQRFAIAVRLADWMAERGEEPEAVDALFESVVEYRPGGIVEYAPSSWWLERGEQDRARELLRAEVERMGESSPYGEQARSRLAALELAAGDPRGGLEEVWKRYDEATERGAKATAFGQLAGVLRGLPDARAADQTVSTLADELSAEGQAQRAELLRAAWLLARGELEELERRLEEFSRRGDELLWTYPVLVDLARQRGDLSTALGHLRRLQASGLASRSRKVRTSIGSLSENQALLAEIGDLLFQLGDEDGARSTWETLFGEQERDQARRVLASLYDLFGLREEALVLLRETLDEDDGTKSVGTLNQVADHERELGNHDEALRLLEKALILSGHSTDQRLRLAAVHRERETLEEHFTQLVTQTEADPGDTELARVVVQLATELGHTEVARATVERLADHPEQAQILRPYMVRAMLLRGDEEGALELYEELLAGGLQEYLRQRLGEQLAAALARRGRLEHAVEALGRAYGDTGGVEFRAALAKLYRNLEHREEALEAVEAVLALDPRHEQGRTLQLELLRELDRPREALEACYAALEDPRLRSGREPVRAMLASLADELGEVSGLAGRLAEEPEDLSTRFRLGLVHAVQRRPARAVDELETVLARQGEHQGALHEIWGCYRDLGRYEESERRLLQLIALLDREQVLDNDDWRARWTLDELRGQVGELYLLRGDREAALAAWKRPLGRSYREVQVYTYAYYNNPLQQVQNESRWLESHGFYREFVAAQRLGSSFMSYNQDYFQAQLFGARYRAGDPLALEDLWRAIAEPGRGLVVGPDSHSRTYYSAEDTRPDARWSTLAWLFREAGRSSELIERVRGELEVDPHDPVMRPLLLMLLASDERWEEVLRLRREDLDESPDDLDEKQRLANVLVELERYEEAAGLFEEVYRAKLATLPEETNERWYRYGEVGSRRGTAGKIRFQWSGGGGAQSGGRQQILSGRGVSPDLTPDPVESAVRRSLMALYARLGRREEARELERVERSLAMLRSWGAEQVPWDLALAYLERGLTEDAERLAAEALDQPGELGEYLELGIRRHMMVHYREAGDEQGRLRWAEGLARHWAEVIAENPYDPAPRVARGSLRLFELGDSAGAAEDLERALALDPRQPEALALRGWVQFEEGEHAAALGSFLEAEQLSLALGLHVDGELQFGIGLAQAAVEGVEAARGRLLRALARGPENRHAARAKELLE